MCSAIMAAFFSLQQLVDMLSIGTLLAYTIVAICVLVLRYEHVENADVSPRRTKWNEVLSISHDNKPSKESSTVTKIAVVFFFILSIILGCLVTFVSFTTLNIVIGSTCIVFMIMTVYVISKQPVDKNINISFKVPLVPLLPCFSIFCNTYLMLQLDGATWIRFGVWLVIGKFD